MKFVVRSNSVVGQGVRGGRWDYSTEFARLKNKLVYGPYNLVEIRGFAYAGGSHEA